MPDLPACLSPEYALEHPAECWRELQSMNEQTGAAGGAVLAAALGAPQLAPIGAELGALAGMVGDTLAGWLDDGISEAASWIRGLFGGGSRRTPPRFTDKVLALGPHTINLRDALRALKVLDSQRIALDAAAILQTERSLLTYCWGWWGTLYLRPGGRADFHAVNITGQPYGLVRGTWKLSPSGRLDITPDRQPRLKCYITQLSRMPGEAGFVGSVEWRMPGARGGSVVVEGGGHAFARMVLTGGGSKMEAGRPQLAGAAAWALQHQKENRAATPIEVAGRQVAQLDPNAGAGVISDLQTDKQAALIDYFVPRSYFIAVGGALFLGTAAGLVYLGTK